MKKKKRGCQIRKPIYFIPVLFLVVVSLFGSARSVYAAADSPSIDWSMNGNSSITVKTEDEFGNSVHSGALTLYRIAYLEQNNGDMVYHYTDDFSGCGYALDDVAEDSSTLAAELAEYAAENNFTGTIAENETGTVAFHDLVLGLYLIVQTEEADGDYAVSPFIVLVPLDVDDEWVYEVEASPKMGILTASPETPEEPDEPATPSTSGKQTVSGSKLPQTGQLFWPIPVLIFAGVFFLVMGGILMRRNRTKMTEG